MVHLKIRSWKRSFLFETIICRFLSFHFWWCKASSPKTCCFYSSWPVIHQLRNRVNSMGSGWNEWLESLDQVLWPAAMVPSGNHWNGITQVVVSWMGWNLRIRRIDQTTLPPNPGMCARKNPTTRLRSLADWSVLTSPQKSSCFSTSHQSWGKCHIFQGKRS